MKNRNTWIPWAIALAAVLFAGALLLRPRFDAESSKHEHVDGHSEGGHEEGREGHGEAGVLILKDEALSESGIGLNTAHVRQLATRLSLQGKVVLNEDRAVHLHPRFPGVILEVRKQLGSRVHPGEVMAVIESNENLQPYSLTSKQGGVVVARHASVGETVSGDDELFTVADLSTVWVDFQVYRQDFARLGAGQRVRVLADGLPAADVRLAYLSPSTETHSQSLLARAELPNRGGEWTPGLFVRGEAAVEEFSALVVEREAVQQFPEGPTLFVREGPDRYVKRGVRLGRRDGDWIEVLEGLQVGETYVSRNSFVLKAELGKGEASHDH